MKQKFLRALCLVTLLGTTLRFLQYDSLPGWREADDEMHYAWAGLTWITEGVPRSWSYLSSYTNVSNYTAWGHEWRLVTPMLEKPPLYLLLNGFLLKTTGVTQLDHVRLSTIRLLPLSLSAVTIFLTGVIGALIISPVAGIIAALLYATTPTLVMANRLSVTENLLTPLFLFGLYFFIRYQKKMSSIIPAAICGGLAVLTKQTGIALPLTFIGWSLYKKDWSALIKLGIAVTVGLGIFFMFGLLYDVKLFLQLASEQHRIGIQGGLPQLLFTILSRPLITTERLFPDGTVVLGYVLLFTAPLWFITAGKLKPQSRYIFLSLPFVYSIYLAATFSAAEAIGSGQGFWGWYLTPLFPFLAIVVSGFLVKVWQQPKNVFLLGLVFLSLGTSTVRYVFLLLPQSIHYRWQWTLMGLLAILVCSLSLPKHWQKIFFTGLFGIYLGVNILLVLHLPQVYPGLSQP